MDSAADLDAFFAFQDHQFGSDQTLDDGTFAVCPKHWQLLTLHPLSITKTG